MHLKYQRSSSILFTTWKRPSPPTHISHCRPDIDLLEGTVNHKHSFHPLAFLVTWGFLANTESVYSTEASVFIYDAVLPHFSQCGFSLPTSGIITLGKCFKTKSHLSCPQGPMYTIVILTWYSAWKYFLLLEKKLSFGASTADIKFVVAFFATRNEVSMKTLWEGSKLNYTQNGRLRCRMSSSHVADERQRHIKQF